MHINININLILLLIICLLNINKINLSIINGGNTDLHNTKEKQKKIDTIKKKIVNIDSKIKTNLVNLNELRKKVFSSSVRNEILDNQMNMQNYITEKESLVDKLEELLRIDNKHKGGITESERLLSKSREITKKFGNIMTDHGTTENKEEENNNNKFYSNKNVESINEDTESINEDAESNNDEDAESNNEDAESDYNNSIIYEEDLDDEYAYNITRDIEMDNFREYTKANTNDIRD